jgi:hypothetical protein
MPRRIDYVTIRAATQPSCDRVATAEQRIDARRSARAADPIVRVV